MTDKIILTKEAKVQITKELQSQITVLHNQCPQGKEWSGLLVYKLIQGDINELVNETDVNAEEEVILRAEHVFPMDFGEATFTSFEGGEDWITFFDLFPHIQPLPKNAGNGYYIGKLHSHNTMPSFHSSTDTTDLVETAPKLPMYLSLVCNYGCIPFAEIAISYQVETDIETKVKEKKSMKIWKWFQADQDEIKEVEKKEKKLVNGTIIIPCSVSYLTDQWLIDQIAVIEAKKRVVQSAVKHEPNYAGFHYNGYGGAQQQHRDNSMRKVGDGSTYFTMLRDLPDLILLGHSTSSMNSQVALETAAKHVDKTNMTEYTKGFKSYFANYWFPVVYRGTETSPKEVLTCMINWANQHDKVWVGRQIKQSCNELKKELTVLRTV